MLDEACHFSSEDEPAPGWRDRLLMWGGLHPLRFAATVALLSLLISLPALPAARPEWVVIPFPDLPSDYSHAAFFGTVWAVQATLVALVYPIVLTFVPILLQRRASARFSLVVYMHDSGVVPAGTSSLLLLAWMSLEYLASPYVEPRYFLFAAVSHGLWFIANLWLTAQFLVKTVKYVRGEFGEAAYRRLAVHYSLRRDLHVALCEHVLDSSILRHGRYSLYSGEPIVSQVGLGSGKAEVVRLFSSARLLSDVNVQAVNWAARRWLERAKALPKKPVKEHERREQPSLQVLPNIGATYIDSVDIVRVSNGPKLTFAERAVFRQAFDFTQTGRSILDGNTGDLLGELAAEVQSQLEQGNYAKAKAEFEKLRDLHAAFVRVASATVGAPGSARALGNLRSGWSWNGRSLNESWMDVYRSLMRVAVSRIEADQTIWKALVHLPSNLVKHCDVGDTGAIREVLQQFVLMDHFLSSWWGRRLHQTKTSLPDEGAWLPQPEREDYRDAVVALVSALTNFGNSFWAPVRRADEGQWHALSRMATIQLQQLDVASTLLFSAVERGDAVAARWHCDNVVHWLSQRIHEFEQPSYGLYDADPSSLHVDVLSLSEEEVRAQIPSQSDGCGGVAEPKTHLWHTLQRHWEAMRLICAALSLELGELEGTPKLAATIASNLLGAKYFQQGLDDGERAFTVLDDILLRYVDLCCVDRPTRNRVHGFVDQVQRGRGIDTPISGWMYSGSRLASHPEALAKQISAILLALDPSESVHFNRTIERVKKIVDIDILRQIGQLIDSLCRAFETDQLRQTFEHAAVLRAAWNPSRELKLRPYRLKAGLLALRQLINSRIVERLASLQVSAAVVDAFALRLSRAMFASLGVQSAPRFVHVSAGALGSDTEQAGVKWQVEREQFTSPPLHEITDSDVKALVEYIFKHARHRALRALLERHSVPQVDGSDEVELLEAVVEACDTLSKNGSKPLVLAPVGKQGSLMFPYNWGWGGRPALPTGITLSMAQPNQDAPSSHEVNGYSVVNLETPGAAFYVIPKAWMERLVFEGSETLGVFTAELQPSEPHELRILISWRAELQQASETFSGGA